MKASGEINVTPLIDIMLVLLIIFMAVTPVVRHSLDASVPRPAPEGASPPAPMPIVLEVHEAGLALNGKPLADLWDLRLELERILGVRSDRTVFVRAAARVRYGDVVQAMDVARTAGAQRLGILGDARGPSSSHPLN